MEAAPIGDGDDPARSADRREEEADRREAEADQRERQMDARERVLDRWEAEVAARAAALQLLDEDQEESRERARARREHEREQRWDAAEARRDAAVERELERAAREQWTSKDGRGNETAEAPAAEGIPRLLLALQHDAPLGEVLELILTAGVDSVPGCAAVSVALATDGRLQTAASTAPWAADLEAAQLRSGCGPVPAAAEPGSVASTANLGAEGGWSSDAAVAADARRSVISFGLVIGSAGPGVLSLYSDLDVHFSEAALRIGDVLAAHAASALARTLERRAYEARTEAWQRALASRDLIGQAKGILMEQRGLTSDEAFNMLRDASQRLNVKLRDLAEHLVTHRRLPDG
jgi:hypothetical protein